MIFNITGGGGSGAALNFNVVAYATKEELMAATPAENTIGVVIETSMTSWIFSTEEPNPATPGMVWIFTGTSSTVAFNALKKNGIQVYPISAKQYISGAWVDKTAKSYQGGKWVDWATFLYSYGDERTDLTGGFSKTAGNNTGTQTLTKNSDHLYLVSEGPDNAGSNFTVATSKKINMGQFSTLCAKVDFKNISSTNLYLGADTSNGILPFNGSCKLEVSNSVNDVISLDISKLSGNYYVYVGLSGSAVSNRGTCCVYEVYLK